MTRKILASLCLLIAGWMHAAAQFSTQEIERMQQMTPAQREAFAQERIRAYQAKARQLSAQSGIALPAQAVDETETAMPVKNQRMLASIPATPATSAALTAYARNLEDDLRRKAGQDDLHWLDTVRATRNALQQHNAATGAWYGHEPLRALLLQLSCARENPQQVLAWSNLGAMLGMAGLPHKAVPILRYCLARAPQQTVVLNNLGQCFAQMGDKAQARQYLERSLAASPLNPDANHTMGMISLDEQKMAEARRYFEQALRASRRASTMAAYIRAGGKVDLAALRAQKEKWTGRRAKNYFDDLALQQFDMPSLPKRMEDVIPFRIKMRSYLESTDQEILFWNSRATSAMGVQEGRYYAHYNRSAYSEIVDALLEKLHGEFSAEFLSPPFPASDLSVMTAAGEAMENEIRLVRETVVAPPGSDAETEEAYQRLRCEKIRAVYDRHMPRVNHILENRYRTLQFRWKSYINQLIPILALDPTPGNRRHAYAAVAGYFGMLKGIAASALAPDFPIECRVEMSLETALEIIRSRREIDLECPDMFQVEGEMFGVDVAVDCDGLKINAGMESEPIGVGYEKDFHTGMSTLWFGIGFEHAFEYEGQALGEASIGSQCFISFDRQNQFADAGYRGNAQFEARGDHAIDFNYAFAINAGFNATLESSGIFEGIGD
jgi:tetratricopeptide (TPR) repeat protein